MNARKPVKLERRKSKTGPGFRSLVKRILQRNRFGLRKRNMVTGFFQELIKKGYTKEVPVESELGQKLKGFLRIRKDDVVEAGKVTPHFLAYIGELELVTSEAGGYERRMTGIVKEDDILIKAYDKNEHKIEHTLQYYKPYSVYFIFRREEYPELYKMLSRYLLTPHKRN